MFNNIDGAKKAKKIEELWRLAREVLEKLPPKLLQGIIEKGGEWKGEIAALAIKLGGEKILAEKPQERPFNAKAYNRQTWNLVWRWGLVVAILTASFWGMWFLATGSVPVVEKILWVAGEQGLPDRFLYLSFPVSRWWDIICIPGLSILLIFSIRTVAPFINDENPIFSAVIIVLGIFLLSSLILALDVGLGVGLGFFLVVGVLLFLSTLMVLKGIA